MSVITIEELLKNQTQLLNPPVPSPHLISAKYNFLLSKCKVQFKTLSEKCKRPLESNFPDLPQVN